MYEDQLKKFLKIWVKRKNNLEERVGFKTNSFSNKIWYN